MVAVKIAEVVNSLEALEQSWGPRIAEIEQAALLKAQSC